ncbi:MAG: VWA domain-containing protein [Geminicoccaceae bacterium]|nr:VWA domain-containing protein [Geminicoccaceae bacterium]
MSKGTSIEPGRAAEVENFVAEMRRLQPVPQGGRRARLIFALDATASRRPAWDRASRVQGEMFLEADRHGGLDVQLAFYRGFDECKASRWVSSGKALVDLMARVDCRAGTTQIGRILRHAGNEAGKKPVQALVFIGDCVEEPVDSLGNLAGELGMRGVRAFMFQEGGDAAAGFAFGEIARLTGGAHCRFDAGSPGELRALLGAVAAYASGGLRELRRLSAGGVGAARMLEQRMG